MVNFTISSIEKLLNEDIADDLKSLEELGADLQDKAEEYEDAPEESPEEQPELDERPLAGDPGGINPQVAPYGPGAEDLGIKPAAGATVSNQSVGTADGPVGPTSAEQPRSGMAKPTMPSAKTAENAKPLEQSMSAIAKIADIVKRMSNSMPQVESTGLVSGGLRDAYRGKGLGAFEGKNRPDIIAESTTLTSRQKRSFIAESKKVILEFNRALIDQLIGAGYYPDTDAGFEQARKDVIGVYVNLVDDIKDATGEYGPEIDMEAGEELADMIDQATDPVVGGKEFWGDGSRNI